MDNENQKQQNLEASAPQPQIALSANSLDIAKPPKTTKKAILYSITLVIIIAVLLGTAIFIQNSRSDRNSSSSTTNSLSPKAQSQDNNTQDNTDNTLNATENPLDTNNQIKSEAQFCSNAINSQLYC